MIISNFADHYFLFDFPGQVELFSLHSNAKSVIMKLIKNLNLRVQTSGEICIFEPFLQNNIIFRVHLITFCFYFSVIRKLAYPSLSLKTRLKFVRLPSNKNQELKCIKI